MGSEYTYLAAPSPETLEYERGASRKWLAKRDGGISCRT